jgi:NAD(P)-dependent dehydrogenase (short-subunit alcohol dehydrogenase family)
LTQVLLGTIFIPRPVATDHRDGPRADVTGRVLLFGASRGLGLALAGAWVDAGRHVTATVRGAGTTALHELAGRHPGQVAALTDGELTHLVDLLQRVLDADTADGTEAAPRPPG